jgi:hypothetical protein
MLARHIMIQEDFGKAFSYGQSNRNISGGLIFKLTAAGVQPTRWEEQCCHAME